MCIGVGGGHMCMYGGGVVRNTNAEKTISPRLCMANHMFYLDKRVLICFQ